MNEYDAAMLLWSGTPFIASLYYKYLEEGVEWLCDLSDDDRLLFWMLVYKAEGIPLP